MRLFPCPSCRAHVGVDARVCVHCHAPLRATVAATAGAIMLGLCGYACEVRADTTSTTTGTTTSGDSGTGGSSSSDSGDTGSSSEAEGGSGANTAEDSGIVVEPEYGVPAGPLECRVGPTPGSAPWALLLVAGAIARRRR